MQLVRRLVSLGHRIPGVWGACRELPTSDLSRSWKSSPVPDGILQRRVYTRNGLSNFCVKNHYGILESGASCWWERLAIYRKWMHSLTLSGRILSVGSFLGISAVVGAMNFSTNVAYAMNGQLEEDLSNLEDPSNLLKQDLDLAWELTKKLQWPAVLLLVVLCGLHQPVTLAINVTLILFCTRPNPFSIYIFIEQLRRRSMHQKPGLYKTKFLYAKKVEVQDYKLLCFANVEVSDAKLRLVGILGSWWILQSLPS